MSESKEYPPIEDYGDDFDCSPAGCGQCGYGDPDCWVSACPDDLCYGGEVPCMHGSYARIRCAVCGN